MDLQHVNAKIFVDGELTLDPARFIEVFHQWIRDEAMDELLIDVADYRHVPAGPGVMLIGLEADYSMDHSGHRWGLRYNRKAPLEGSNEDRFRQAFRSAARACRQLETQLTGDAALRFSRHEFELLVNDRALAPNTPETYTACKRELESFLEGLLGDVDFHLTPFAESRSRFGVTIKAAKPFDLSAIVDTLRPNTRPPAPETE